MWPCSGRQQINTSWSHITTTLDQQNIVDSIYHTLVERGEQLSKYSNFYTSFVLKAVVRGDPVVISQHRLVTEHWGVGAIML